jgi:hypothetical protein
MWLANPPTPDHEGEADYFTITNTNTNAKTHAMLDLKKSESTIPIHSPTPYNMFSHQGLLGDKPLAPFATFAGLPTPPMSPIYDQPIMKSYLDIIKDCDK